MPALRVRVRNVHPHIPLWVYQDVYPRESGYTRNSYVSAECVREAQDRWEAIGIVHDIDTQWGALPQ